MNDNYHKAVQLYACKLRETEEKIISDSYFHSQPTNDPYFKNIISKLRMKKKVGGK